MKRALPFLLSGFALLLSCSSCSTNKDMGRNQIPEGHERLYTYPEQPSEYLEEVKGGRYKEIIFAVMNDTDGKILPNSRLVVDPAQNQNFDIHVGGISGYKAYLKILKDKFPGRVQVVSSGSFLSAKSDTEKTLFHLNYLGLDVAGLSKGEFSLDLGKNYVALLDKNLKQAKFKIISSNLFNLEKAEPYKLKKILQSAMTEVNGVKIGYISMVSPAMARRLDTEKLNKVYFQPMAANIIKTSNELRKEGADIVALIAANGMDCTSQQSQTQNISPFKVNFSPANEKVCDLYQNHLAQTLAKLPPKKVDIVFTNGIDSKVANFVSGYPILQSYPGGEHLSWARVVYDTKFKVVAQNGVDILQPVQLCHKFFKETEDCFSGEALRNIELAPAIFLGEQVEIQPLPSQK